MSQIVVLDLVVWPLIVFFEEVLLSFGRLNYSITYLVTLGQILTENKNLCIIILMPEENKTDLPPQTETPKQTNTGNNLLLLAAVAVILLATVVGYFYVAGKNSSTGNTTKTTKNEATKSATKAAEKDETADWKTYQNSQLNFLIKYPAEWTKEEKKPVIKTGEAGIIFKGTEGQVEIDWEDAWGGGGCPEYVDLKAKSSTIRACHYVENNVERWVITPFKSISGLSIYGYAVANAPYSSNRAVILEIISTLETD